MLFTWILLLLTAESKGGRELSRGFKNLTDIGERSGVRRYFSCWHSLPMSLLPPLTIREAGMRDIDAEPKRYQSMTCARTHAARTLGPS